MAIVEIGARRAPANPAVRGNNGKPAIVTDIAEARKVPEAPRDAFEKLSRSPELALIISILMNGSDNTMRLVASDMKSIAKACPDCEAAEQAVIVIDALLAKRGL